MKKILFSVGVILIAIMLSGCSNQQSGPSKEELEAKIKYAVDKCIEGGGIPTFFSDGTFSGCKRQNFIKIN
jgi:PBP1b-binding outer membrane lipoprotein LpoB